MRKPLYALRFCFIHAVAPLTSDGTDISSAVCGFAAYAPPEKVDKANTQRRGFDTNTFCNGGQAGRLWKLSSSLSYRTAAETQGCISFYSHSQPKARERSKASFVSSSRALRSAAPLSSDSHCVLSLYLIFFFPQSPLTVRQHPNRRPRQFQNTPTRWLAHIS